MGLDHAQAAGLKLKKYALPPGVEAGGHGGSHGYLGDDFMELMKTPQKDVNLSASGIRFITKDSYRDWQPFRRARAVRQAGQAGGRRACRPRHSRLAPSVSGLRLRAAARLQR